MGSEKYLTTGFILVMASRVGCFVRCVRVWGGLMCCQPQNERSRLSSRMVYGDRQNSNARRSVMQQDFFNMLE